jgi:hypothetical protein
VTFKPISRASHLHHVGGPPKAADGLFNEFFHRRLFRLKLVAGEVAGSRPQMP